METPTGRVHSIKGPTDRPEPEAEPKKWMAVIRTGLRRTDERTGRTIERMIRSQLEETQHAPNPSLEGGFFAEYVLDTGKSVRCERCGSRHPLIDPFKAIVDGRISGDQGNDAATVSIETEIFIEAVMEAARPKAVRS